MNIRDKVSVFMFSETGCHKKDWGGLELLHENSDATDLRWLCILLPGSGLEQSMFYKNTRQRNVLQERHQTRNLRFRS